MNCFYCDKKMGFNDPYWLIRTWDERFRGRKRWQTAAYCCLDCEGEGKPCKYNRLEWEKVVDEKTKRLQEAS